MGADVLILMPDSTPNHVLDTTNGPVGVTSMTRAEFITALEQLNYAAGRVRNLDELTTAGILNIETGGAINPRTLSAADNTVTVSNGDGVSGNPTFSLGTAPNVRAHALTSDKETLTSAGAMNSTLMVSELNFGSGTATLSSPASSLFKTIVNINASASTVTITNYQTPSGGTPLNYASGASLPAGESLTIYGNGTNWYPVGGTTHSVYP